MRRIFEAVYQVFFDKKWGILIKMESESLIFTGLEIQREYLNEKASSDSFSDTASPVFMNSPKF